MSVITGPGTISTSLPNASDFNLVISRQELATPVIYKRPPKNSQQLAAQFINKRPAAPARPPRLPKGRLHPGADRSHRSPDRPTPQGADWWVFPGASLKCPPA